MRGVFAKAGLMLGVAVLALLVAGAGTAAKGKAAKGGTLVFGASADPVVLDPALVSDGESFRPARQIFQGLIGLKPGTTIVRPELATKWKSNKAGTVWTFTLRKGVKFHDNTRFNAAAVCANFNRWYNFSGPFQSASATYYWQAIFGGFKHNDDPSLPASLYKSCRASGAYTAVISLAKRYGPFIPALSLPAFAIQSPTAMAKYGANQGEIRNGNFVATGTYGFQHPTGTGPLKFESWTIKQKLVLVRNNSYWGKKSNLDRVIFTPISDPTARLQALQTGEIQGYDLVNPPDVPTIQRSGSLKIVSRPAFNVGYVTINQKSAPFNNLLVRQAVAYGLDRKAVVRNFYAGRGTVAQEFMPPSIFGWTSKVPKYSFNPTKAKQLLQKAGLKLPVNVDFWYPTSVSRPYMPNPQANFEVFSASLEKSGFHVVPHSAPWRPDYVKKVDEGTAGDLNLIGWTGDYGDPDNFVGVFFGHRTDQFGFNNKAIFNILAKAQQTTNFATRVKLYQQANVMIMKFLPGVPYVHTKPALGFKKSVTGFIPSPVQEESFADINVGGQ